MANPETHAPHCVFCVDEHLTGTREEGDIALMYTIVPFTTGTMTAQGTVVTTASVPCCLFHRREQVKPSSSLARVLCRTRRASSRWRSSATGAGRTTCSPRP
jgi:hypothetical protein